LSVISRLSHLEPDEEEKLRAGFFMTMSSHFARLGSRSAQCRLVTSGTGQAST